MSYNCGACPKTYKSSRALVSHTKSCKSIFELKIGELQNEICQLKEECEQYREQEVILHKEILNLQYQLKIQGLQKDLSFAQTCAEKNEQAVNKFQDHILEQNSKARYTTVIHNTLAPFTLTPEKAMETAKLYTVDDFKRGPEATLEFITEKQLKDSFGKPIIICTDPSRLVFRGHKPDGEPFIDMGGSSIIGLIRDPMRQAVTHAYIDIMNAEDESQHESAETKLRSHRQALEPKRLTQSIARRTKKS